jgi:hypothetical protein
MLLDVAIPPQFTRSLTMSEFQRYWSSPRWKAEVGIYLPLLKVRCGSSGYSDFWLLLV